jgi:hypothetical protein
VAFLLLCVTGALALGGGRALAGSGPLDGKTFVGESGEKGQTKSEAEQIDFKGGTFHSKNCDPYGFAPAPYKATSRAGVTTFEATTTSAKEGKIVWKGTVKGDTLEGTLLWTKAGQKDIEYWVKGQLKK